MLLGSKSPSATTRVSDASGNFAFSTKRTSCSAASTLLLASATTIMKIVASACIGLLTRDNRGIRVLLKNVPLLTPLPPVQTVRVVLFCHTQSHPYIYSVKLSLISNN